jgi:hypothetical protein
MVDFSEVEKLVQSNLELIVVSPESYSEYKERAGNFLVIQAFLVTYLKDVVDELSKQESLKEAVYADAISEVEGKSITEKKINVAKKLEYVSIRESFDQLESVKEWIKGHIKIFENAHILYRGFSREM